MIRKSPLIVSQSQAGQVLDLEQIARFEVSSEDPNFPLEGMLKGGFGWRAKDEGPQTLRIVFDAPQSISRVLLVFEEKEFQRMQEFTLAWRSEAEGVFKQLRRQQFNFSPPDTTSEREEFNVSLQSVMALELWINPAVSGYGRASVTRLEVK